MPKKVQIKTTRTKANVSDYLNAIEPVSVRKDAKQLAKVFKAATGTRPRMWGSSIVGYGAYTYYRANGDEGEFMATGFAMRKSGPVLYIMPGYADFAKILSRLGPHRLGKSCLYLKSLHNIDLDVVAELIMAGLEHLKQTHTVKL